MLGIGTVLTPEQAEEAKRRGADFAVSPGCNVRVIDAAQKAGLPFAPGIMTPSEIEQSLEHGYKHLDVSFIPLGGLKLANMGEYLSSPLVAAIGGSWIAPAKLINERDWAAIRKNAEEATAALNA